MRFRQLTSPITFGITQSIVGVDGGVSAPLPNGSITVASRGAVFFDGVSDYYTMLDSASLDFPDADWTVLTLAKITKNSGVVSSTQHILCIGNSGSTHNVQLFMNGAQVSAIIRAAGAPSTTAVGATLTASASTYVNGWYIIGVRRTGTNYQVFSCPLNGTVTNGATQAFTTPGVITPAAVSGNAVFIGGRSDLIAARMWGGTLSYVCKINAALSDANIQALAAGSDPITDLGLSPSFYTRFDSAAATISDTSGNGNTATRAGAPISRGGPDWAGRAIRIGRMNGLIDAFYNFVWQRNVSTNSRVITFNGTYSGAPAGLEARVLYKDGTAATAFTRCTTPSAGVWNVTLDVPQGPELTLEVRDTVTTTNFQRTQLPWGVGIQLGIIGESIAAQQINGSGWTDSASTDYPSTTFSPNRHQSSIFNTPDSWLNSTSYSSTTGGGALVVDVTTNKIYRCTVTHTSPASGTLAADIIANPTRWTELDASIAQVDVLNNTAGAIMHTVDRVRKHTGLPVMAVNGAKSGSKLASGPDTIWWGAPYNQPITHGHLQVALNLTGNDVERWIWAQGANDANDASPPSAATYQAALEALFPVFASYLPYRTAAQCPAIIPICGTNTGGGSAVDAGWRQVRNGGRAALPNITAAYNGSEMYDLTHSAEGAYSPHPDAAGYIRLNKRQAQAILNTYDPATYSNGVAGAVVASASITATDTVDVVFTLNTGATTLQGLTGSTGLTGFRVLRSGTPQTISAAVVQSANTIRLTVTGVTAGDVVEYVDTQNPTITNMVYTNAPVIGDAAGVPVQAFTAGIALS